MRRRDLITIIGAAAAWPLAARAQQGGRMRRVGARLGFAESDSEALRNVAAFRQRLAQLGWVAGQTIQIDDRWVAADVARIRSHAAELVAQKPDVILATSGLVVDFLLRET